MNRNKWFLYIVWLCIILFTGSQVHSKEQSLSSKVGFNSVITYDDGTVSQALGTGKEKQSGLSISGFLLAQDDAPQPKTEVRLVIVRLVNLLGKEILKLPPTETVIIDSDSKAVMVTETNSSGKFEFKDVKPGRYALAVLTKGGGVGTQLWLEDNLGKTIIFDVTDTNLELGMLKAAKD